MVEQVTVLEELDNTVKFNSIRILVFEIGKDFHEHVALVSSKILQVISYLSIFYPLLLLEDVVVTFNYILVVFEACLKGGFPLAMFYFWITDFAFDRVNSLALLL